MAQPFANMKKRTSVLVFIKGAAAPLVLYVENPISVYEELAGILKRNSAAPVIIEKSTLGPVKKVCINSNDLAAIALQDEPYM